MTPQARLLVRSMLDAGRPLTMGECAALLQAKKAVRRPAKVVAWYFAKVFSALPASSAESREGGRS